MKRRLQHECDLVPISPEQLRNANDLIKTVTFTKKPQERTMAKKMFEKGMAELADCRESRRCKRSDEAKQLLELQKVRHQEQMDKAAGLMVKEKKAAIIERSIVPPKKDAATVGKRAKATISPPSASIPLQPAAFDDDDSNDDCDKYPFVLEATAVSEPK